MSKKKKCEIKITGFTFNIDGKEVFFKREDVYLYPWSEPCEVCGSHDGIRVSVFYEDEHIDFDI